jgi:flagellin
MTLRINDSQATQNTQRQLAGTQNQQAKTMERLATGKRVNNGMDSAVALAISSSLGGDIRALNQSVRNANDGISLTKVGDSALNEMSTMFQRMQELANQRGNGALSGEDQSAIDEEMGALQTEINHIQANTRFNDTNLLTGLNQTFTVGETETYSLLVDPVNVDVGNNTADIETAMDNINKARSEFGQAASVLGSRAADSAVRAENLSAARSQIMDADVAAEMAQLTRTTLLQRSGVAIQTQANMSSTSVMALLKD